MTSHRAHRPASGPGQALGRPARWGKPTGPRRMAYTLCLSTQDTGPMADPSASNKANSGRGGVGIDHMNQGLLMIWRRRRLRRGCDKQSQFPRSWPENADRLEKHTPSRPDPGAAVVGPDSPHERETRASNKANSAAGWTATSRRRERRRQTKPISPFFAWK